MKVAAGRKNGPKAVDVLDTVIVLEDMKESTVEHVVELFVEVRQLEGVPNQEPGSQAPVAGFALRDGDGGLDRVDAGGLVAKAGGHEGMLSGPTADVEDSTAQNASLGKFKESGLRSADVPRGGAGIGRIEVPVPTLPRTRHTVRVLPYRRSCTLCITAWPVAAGTPPPVRPPGRNDLIAAVDPSGVLPPDRTSAAIGSPALR